MDGMHALKVLFHPILAKACGSGNRSSRRQVATRRAPME
jgi:hypothetical protein